MKTHKQGFSLIELIITLSVSAILLAIGVPSFNELSDTIRANTNIKTIQQTLQLARNIAINYGYRVTVCPLVHGKCTQDLQKGLTVFTDSGTVETLDVNDKVISRIDEFDTKDFLTYNKSSIRFQPDGLASPCVRIVVTPK